MFYHCSKVKVFYQITIRNAAQKEKFANMDLEPRENTPAMEAVIQMRAQRLAAGICTPITPEPSDDENDTEIGTVVKVRLITQCF